MKYEKIIKQGTLSKGSVEDLRALSEKDVKGLLAEGHYSPEELEKIGDNRKDEKRLQRVIERKLKNPAMHDAALPKGDMSFDDILSEFTGGNKQEKGGFEGREQPRMLPPRR